MIQLSYSSLSIFKECLRCFYLDRKLKIPRPQGIKSGVPVAVDNILKQGLEVYRGSLPPVLKNIPELEGFQLYDGSDLAKMRHWKSNPLKMTDTKGNIIVGAFDDLLFNPNTKEYAYLDYKTTGKEPSVEFGERYYQSQCDIYTRFLEVGKKKVASFGCLLFFWPVKNNDGGVDFKSMPVFLTPNTANAESLFKEAIQCLESDVTPPSGPDCEFCRHFSNRLANESFAVAQ